MTTATLKRFDTEQDLFDYADQLNEGGMSPEIALMDSAGISVLGCLQAPGGDGWGFAYYAPNDEDGYIVGDSDGGWVTPRRYVGEGRDVVGWKPEFPVFGIVADPT